MLITMPLGLGRYFNHNVMSEIVTSSDVAE